MRYPSFVLFAAALTLAPPAAQAAAQISRSLLGAGGGTATGGTATLRSSIGQALAGGASGATIHVGSGFWTPGGGSTGLPGEDLLPASFRYRGNHPNPFNPHTILAFDLPKAAAGVKLRILDAQGRQVALLVDEALPAGRHQVVWDGRDDRGHACSSGLYFSLLETPSNRATGKLTLLR